MTRRVLVVDDDADIRRLASMSLSRVGGYEVSSVASGSECLEQLAGELPDAVVLDVMMPVMDGPATLLGIRDNPRTHDLPVVFLTAGVVDADVDRLRTMAVSGVLQKPFDPLLLPGQLADVLGW